MTDSTNAQAVAPVVQSLRVVCEKCGKPLGGLFVVLAPAVPEGTVATVLEAGEDGSAAATTRTEVPNEPSHSIGMTNPEGYLEPIVDENPWHHFFGDRVQHNLPCLPQQSMWLVRHPNAELVRAFVRWLDTGEQQEGYDFASWGAPATLAFQGTPTTEADKQLVLKVPEDSKHFLPPGPALYQGWSLYRDMPNAQCGPVVSQVARLQRHLGALRYPIGRQEYPYWPEPRQAPNDILRNEGEFDGRTQAALARFQENSRAGTAARVLDPTLAHGKHVEPTAPFAPKAGGGGAAGAWAYLVAVDEALSGEAALTVFTFGCVDASTGAAIAAWLEKGLRKPGPLLLDVHLGRFPIWLRQEAAVATEAWLELLKAFGAVYPWGLSSGHSFRNVLDKGSGGGKRLNSIHKTGLAVDMTSIGYTTMRPEWPVRIEGEWIKDNPALRAAQQKLATLEKDERKLQLAYDKAPATAAEIPKGKHAKLQKDIKPGLDAAKLKTETQRKKIDQLEAEAALDEQGKKNKFRLRFRIYVHSSRNVFSWPWTMTDELQDLRRELAQCQSGLRTRLAKKLGSSDDTAWSGAANGWLDDAAKTVNDASRAICTLDDAEIVNRFFRANVRPWIYNPYALDGGTEGKSLAPHEALLPYYPPPPAGAKSYVNASALGGLCKMARISATRNGCWKDPSGMKGKRAISTVSVSKGLPPIIEALEFMKAPRSAHQDDTIPVTHAKTEVELAQKEIDLEALRTWSKLLSEVTNASGRSGVAKTTMPQLSITMAIAAPRKDAFEKVLKLIESTKCKVLVTSAGGATHMADAVQTIVACSTVASTLRKAASELETQAKKEKADLDVWKKEVADARKQRRKPNVPKPVPSKPRTTAELTVTLQPIFVVGATPTTVLFYPKDTVELPVRGNPQGLEWWHFQHEAAYKRPWGELLEEAGYSQQVLQAGEVPESNGTFWGRGVDYDASNFPDASGGVGVLDDQIEDNYNEYKPWAPW